MSVMNMLSDTAPVQAAPVPYSPAKSLPQNPATTQLDVKSEPVPRSTDRPSPAINGTIQDVVSMKHEPNGEQAPIIQPSIQPVVQPDVQPISQRAPPALVPAALGPPGLTVRATEEAFARIVESADASDLEEPGFEAMRGQWTKRGSKRTADIEAREDEKRKVRLLFRSHVVFD